MSEDCLWSPLPDTLALSTGEVHVWCASLDPSVSYLQQLFQTLSADEQDRAERFHFEQHKQRFIAARGILRQILGRYLEINPKQLQFVYGSRGKPALKDNYNGELLNFNVSHSQDLAVYAVSKTCNLGIDLEYTRPMPDAEKIVERFFSEREKEFFFALSDNQKLLAFFNAWTRKEAYLKATGDGLAGHLNQIEVSLVPGEPAKLLSINGDVEAACCWLLQELKPASSYVAALAVEGRNCNISCWQWQEKS